jgi:hypothetical protein
VRSAIRDGKDCDVGGDDVQADPGHSLQVTWRDVRAAASPPTQLPTQYSPALTPGTTRFGMERGGIDVALGHAHILPVHHLRRPGFCPWLQSSLNFITRHVRQEHRRHTLMCVGHVCLLHHVMSVWCFSRAPLCCAGLSCQRTQAFGFALDHEHGSAPVCYQPSTCRLATGSSLRGLTSFLSEKALLGAGFPLRCCQRLSLPNVATQRCRLRDNWYTSGSSSPVLSY